MLFSVIKAEFAARFGCGVHRNAVVPASDHFEGNQIQSADCELHPKSWTQNFWGAVHFLGGQVLTKHKSEFFKALICPILTSKCVANISGGSLSCQLTVVTLQPKREKS